MIAAVFILSSVCFIFSRQFSCWVFKLMPTLLQNPVKVMQTTAFLSIRFPVFTNLLCENIQISRGAQKPISSSELYLRVYSNTEAGKCYTARLEMYFYIQFISNLRSFLLHLEKWRGYFTSCTQLWLQSIKQVGHVPSSILLYVLMFFLNTEVDCQQFWISFASSLWVLLSGTAAFIH